jgi:methylmalonyl-CoA mutase
MSNFFNDFEGSTKEQWNSRLEADLKGKAKAGILEHHDEIEDISFHSDIHFSQNEWTTDTPGTLPYTRTGKFKDNTWVINNFINEIDPQAANKKALDRLMKGATGIIIHLNGYTKEECERAIQEIGLEYIHSTFYYSTEEQYNWLKGLKQTRPLLSASFINIGSKNFLPIDGVRNILIDAAQVPKCGGNCAQEVAFALYKGHEKLYELLESGKYQIDEAVPQLKFRFGISSNYFFEMVKYRCFRRLWSEIVLAYNPKHDCSSVPFIEAETISLNKSLKDPYTNLLRLTTESLSAILGGVDELTLHSFDAKSNAPNIEKHQRLVNNIALILQDESYMNLVIDPAGGSYSLEKLTSELTDKAWTLFQEFDLKSFKQAIKEKAQKRIELIEKKEHKKVGINHFMNEGEYPGKWNEPEVFELGSELILERDCKIELA